MFLHNPRTTNWLLIGVLASASLLLNGCSGLDTRNSTTQSLTAITQSPTNTYHPGKFVWHDLLTPDTSASREFYGKLFGWSFSRQGEYVEVFNNGRKIAGFAQLAPKDGKEASSVWLMSISVPDVDAAAKKAEALKGQILNGPVDMPLRGRGVLISDPLGAHFVALHAKDGDPEDQEPGMGDWLWNEIWSNQPDKTIDFYRAVGNYQDVRKNDDYAILINEGKWRAGVRFSNKNDTSILWVPAVRVADPGALLAKVESLGGTVWIKPGDIPGKDDIALISDNAGALLILQRWTFSNPEEGH